MRDSCCRRRPPLTAGFKTHADTDQARKTANTGQLTTMLQGVINSRCCLAYVSATIPAHWGSLTAWPSTLHCHTPSAAKIIDLCKACTHHAWGRKHNNGKPMPLPHISHHGVEHASAYAAFSFYIYVPTHAPWFGLVRTWCRDVLI